jgi:hypothetical protein
MATGNSKPAVAGHVDCVMPKSMLRPGPALNIDHEQWVREQRALNWWDALAPEMQVYIHAALRDSIVPLVETH